jgi:acetoin utilization deacetylase AcuC-like enzyme
MKIIYTPEHKNHRPPWEYINNEKFPHAEVPERIEMMVGELKNNGLGDLFIGPKPYPLKHILAIHHKNYVEFFKEKADLLKKGEAYYPSSYIMDTYTPIMEGTYKAAIEAVNCALTGADLLEKESIVYALCRPPGHHAESNILGGYCYFNNAAVAAEYLSKKGKVAILDIDFHHGNGTQRIFYDRSDVLYVSLHADPKLMYPYISGFVEEKGVGKGEGYNYNFPLPLSTTNEQYEKTLLEALQITKKYKPDYFIISCGFDTYEKDPIAGLKLTIPFYETIAKHIMALKLPTLVLQEGGYYVEDLGKIAHSFAKGLMK